MTRVAISLIALGSLCLADNTAHGDHPTGNRTTPPTLSSATPLGVSRGTTVEFTVEGLNLASASRIYFSETGIKGTILRVKELPDLPDIRLGSNGTPSTIDLGPLPPRNQVTVELDVSPDAPIGPVRFRLQTPLGTSPEGRFVIEPYYGETGDQEPNNSIEQATEVFLPSILVGAISRSGDADYFKVKVKAGEELVFENGARMTGSTLQPVVTILREDQSVVGEFGKTGGMSGALFAHRFEQAGTYYLRLDDYEQSGKASHTYRWKLGAFPVVTSAFPLGVRKGETAQVAFKGLHLGSQASINVKGEPSGGSPDSLLLRPGLGTGTSVSELRLAVGQDPEVLSNGGNLEVGAAQAISAPATINGRIAAPNAGKPTENYFRFSAKKGQQFVLEVQAKRLGSELDSLIEVLDAKGNPVEVATVRSTLETFTTLRDHDSVQPGIRLSSITGLGVGDYILLGSEIAQIESMPRGPDDDAIFTSFGRQRIAFFGSSPESHAVDRPIYKVQMFEPGRQFTTNGLPLVRLYAQNDDGGPGFGKDSRLAFTAPADGDFVARIRDVRGLGGDDYSYRLNIRPPRPDFQLAVTPKNPNVPVGGTIPLSISALRLDGFNGPIEVTLDSLPPGLKATPAVIHPWQVSTTILLTAADDIRVETAIPLKPVGRAKVGSETLARYADPEDDLKLIALMPRPDILVTAETKEVTIEAGGTADVLISVLRQNGFGGRVPVEVLNLPPRVRVLDVGLNGVLVTESEKQRSFTLEALPSAKPLEQVIYVSGNVETRSTLNSSYAAIQPILLRVKPKAQAAAATPAPTRTGSDSGAPK